MRYITYKELLQRAIYSYYSEQEGRLALGKPEGDAYPGNMDALYLLEHMLLENFVPDNKDMGLLVSNFPFLLDYMPEGCLDEFVRGRNEARIA